MFIVHAPSPVSLPEASGKVIKAQDFWAFQDARRTVERARQERERILDSAREAYERERERGYAEGSESARREQSGSMVEVLNQTARYFGRVEQQMVELVLEAVQKVVSNFDDRERVSVVVRNCLELLRSQKQLIISVHPSHIAFMRAQVEELRRDYPGLAQIDVQPDARLDSDACVVESDIGVVEASLAGQVQVLRDTLGGVFARELEPVAGDAQ